MPCTPIEKIILVTEPNHKWVSSTPHRLQKGRVSLGLRFRNIWARKTDYGLICFHLNLLDIQKWKSYSFPKIVAVFTCNFKMFIPFFFYQRIVLNGNCVPHEIFLKVKKLMWHFISMLLWNWWLHVQLSSTYIYCGWFFIFIGLRILP